ncbi:hypothetical protein B0H10DRAFT_1937677 [Mycena sp. CBHHK59/15]|nr:hypothetical protein B0H10DRAFT_1937677 [Mycena sp. CBHHK59/15]
MTTIPPFETNASSPQGELEALVAKVAALTAKSVELTQLCVDVQSLVPSVALSKTSIALTSLCVQIQTEIPLIIASQVAAAVAEAAPAALAPSFVQGTPRTPTQLEAAHPPGSGDFQTWHVVIRGREPGLYASVEEADAQVLGVPNQFRQKKTSRVEALAFYRLKYTDQKVEKWTDAPAAAAPAVVAAAPTAVRGHLHHA